MTTYLHSSSGAFLGTSMASTVTFAGKTLTVREATSEGGAALAPFESVVQIDDVDVNVAWTCRKRTAAGLHTSSLTETDVTQFAQVSVSAIGEGGMVSLFRHINPIAGTDTALVVTDDRRLAWVDDPTGTPSVIEHTDPGIVPVDERVLIGWRLGFDAGQLDPGFSCELNGVEVLVGTDARSVASTIPQFMFSKIGAANIGEVTLIVAGDSLWTNGHVPDPERLRLAVRVASADGTISHYAPSSGEALWAMLEDDLNDGDTTHIAHNGALSGAGQADFGLSAAPANIETVHGVLTLSHEKRQGSTGLSRQSGLVSGGVASLTSSSTVGTTYALYGKVHLLDPASGTPEWDADSIAAFTMRTLNGGSPGGEHRVSTMRAMIVYTEAVPEPHLTQVIAPMWKGAAEFNSASDVSVVDASAGNPLPFELRNTGGSAAVILPGNEDGVSWPYFPTQTHISLWFRIEALPDTEQRTLLWTEDLHYDLLIDTEGKLILDDLAGAQTEGPVIGEGWHHLEFALVPNEAVPVSDTALEYDQTLTVRLDGAVVFAVTDQMFPCPRIHLSTGAADGHDFRYHSIIYANRPIDSSAVVRVLRIAGVGVNDEWAGEDKAAAVDEDAPDGADTVITATGNGDRQGFTIEPLAAAAQVLAVKAGFMLGADLLTVAETTMRIGMRSGEALFETADMVIPIAATVDRFRSMSMTEIDGEKWTLAAIEVEVALTGDIDDEFDLALCTAIRVAAIIKPLAQRTRRFRERLWWRRRGR